MYLVVAKRVRIQIPVFGYPESAENELKAKSNKAFFLPFLAKLLPCLMRFFKMEYAKDKNLPKKKKNLVRLTLKPISPRTFCGYTDTKIFLFYTEMLIRICTYLVNLRIFFSLISVTNIFSINYKY